MTSIIRNTSDYKLRVGNKIIQKVRSKLVNENVEDILKGKSSEEIEKIIKETGSIPTEYLNKLINKEIGSTIKVNFTGAWDRFGPIKNSKIITINRGNGFEKCLAVSWDEGTFIYMPPYKVSSFPDENTMLTFYANEALYIHNDFFIHL